MTHLSLPMEAVPPSVSRHGVAHPRYPIATESALQSPVCLWQNSLGVFHCSLFVSLASFAGRISESKGPPLLRPEQNGLTSHPSYPRKAGYVCTQRYGTPRRRCTALQVSHLFRTQLGNTTQGVRLCTRTGLHGNRVGVTMPLEIALSPQARMACFPPAPTQNWAYQAGTRGFIDVPFRGFLAPPSETADLTRILRRRLANFSIARLQ